MSALRVGFVSGRSLSREGSVLYGDAGVGRVVNALAQRFEHLEVAMSLAPQRHPLHDEKVTLAPERFHAFPFIEGVVRGLRQVGQCRPVLRALEDSCDVLLVQLPFAVSPALLWPRTPRVYHLCADIFEVVRTSSHYRGAKHVAAMGLAQAIHLLQRQLIGRGDASLVANGAELLAKYSNATGKGRAVVSATLLDAEVDSVQRHRPPGVFRLLYVGYLRTEKGFDVLLETCEQLFRTQPGRFELQLVGASDTSDRGVGATLRARLEALGQVGHVDFLGAKNFGPELFEVFANADALVLPSLSEGTPRVLVEARAFGCPVIASRVGGVPTSVTDEVDGLLVPPGDAAALTRAVTRLAGDSALHERLRQAGYARASACTVEKFVDQMAGEIELVA